MMVMAFQHYQYNKASMEQVQEVQHNALQQVKIHSSAVSVIVPGVDWNPFTLYTLTVSCPATKTWWTVKKRFSEVFAMRKTITSIYKKASRVNALSAVEAILLPVVDMEFPKRYLRVDNKEIVLERRRGLKRFLKALIAVRAECFVHLLQAESKETNENGQSRPTNSVTVLAQEIFELVQEFLEIPDTQKDEELRQALQILAHDKHDTDCQSTKGCCFTPEEPCSICLYDFELDPASTGGGPVENVLNLPCGHYFHEDCVIQWFDSNDTCPLCRAEATSGTML